MSVRPMSVPEFQAAKASEGKLAVVTAYDYTSAKLADEAGVDAILVGDSLGMVIQGHPTSLPVTLRDIIYHTRCVVRGVRRALVIADLPFLTYQVSPEQALKNAGRVIQQTGAQAVKLEGGVGMASTIEKLVRVGIPVVGHIGLTPQSVHQFGGFKVQRDRMQLMADVKAVADAGAFAVVIESVPADLSDELTRAVAIPTIGIGAGSKCDGQVLVFHDLLGLFTDFKPKFVKRYADIGSQIRLAIEAYCGEVREGAFPTAEHSFK